MIGRSGFSPTGEPGVIGKAAPDWSPTCTLARLRLGHATIAAPIDGLAGARLAEPGNLVKTNDTALVTINQIEPIYLSFALPERHFAQLRRLLGEGGLGV